MQDNTYLPSSTQPIKTIYLQQHTRKVLQPFMPIGRHMLDLEPNFPEDCDTTFLLHPSTFCECVSLLSNHTN